MIGRASLGASLSTARGLFFAQPVRCELRQLKPVKQLSPQPDVLCLHPCYLPAAGGVCHLKTATVCLQPEIAELHAHLIPQLAGLARNLVRDLDPQASHIWMSQPHCCFG